MNIPAKTSIQTSAWILCLALTGNGAAVADASAPRARLLDEARGQYVRILAALQAEGRLDDDGVALGRTERILSGLVAAIPARRGDFSWEVHVTSDPRVDALAMPGGKMVIGTAFVERLRLDDAELATLMAHEMGHVIAGHLHEREVEALEADVSQRLRVAAIAYGQETEADEIGMNLAYRAGWPAAGIVGFYEKVAAAEAPATFSATHPQGSARLAHAHEIAGRWAPSPR